MTTIKDRLKMFEANGPQIKPKPPKKLSNTDTGIIIATENDESIKKSENDLINIAEIPTKSKNEVSKNVHKMLHEQVGDQLHQKKSDFNETTHNVADRSEVSFDSSVKGCIENDKEDVINNKENKESGKDVIIPNLPVDDLSEKDSDDDLLYEYCGSIYYLPGLENFFSIEGEHPETTIVPPVFHNENNSNEITNDLHTNPTVQMQERSIETDLNIEEVAINLKRNASKRLIEEIFNTSMWRNSVNYNDNFIFTPNTSTNSNNGTEFDSSEKNSSNDFSSIISSSPSNDERRKSVQSLSSKPIKRNIFSGMFRSKRGPKKSSQPSQTNEISDSDAHQESASKKSTHSKTVEGDIESVDLATKKPLNTFFNRDWLNSLGEGIKKKANVMSELRKVFSHSKGKNPKNKPSKSVAGVSNKGIKLDISKGNETVEDDLYDDGGEEIMSSEEDSEHLTMGSRQAEKGNINNILPICKGNEEDIYDEDDDNDCDDGINNNNDLQTVVKSSSKESVYDDGGEDEVSDNQYKQITKHSSHESLYNDGGEEETLDSSNQEDHKAPLVEMRRNNVADLKKTLKINLNTPIQTTTKIDIPKPPVIDDSIYDDEDDENSEEEKIIYSKEKVMENLILIHMIKNPIIGSKKSDPNSEKIQKPEKTSSIRKDPVKIEPAKLQGINKKSDESREIVNQSKTNKKSNNNNVSDLKSFLQKLGNNKSNNQKSEKVQKVKASNKKTKINFVKLKNDNKCKSKKIEEYDMDDENVEEYEYDVENEDEVVTEAGFPNSQQNKPTSEKMDDDMYDMDNNDIEEYISDEIDDPISASVCQNNTTKLDIQNKKKKNSSKKDKNKDYIYDDDEEDEEADRKYNDSKIEPQKLSSKKSEIIKKNIKTKQTFVEEYQEDANISASKEKVLKDSKKNKLKMKQNVPLKSDNKIDDHNSKNCHETHDEEYDEEEFNEVYVSDVEIIEKKKKNVTKQKYTSVDDEASKKTVDNANKEKKKNLKKYNTNSKTKILDSQNDSKKPNKKSKLAMETYIYDEDESLTNDSPENKCSNNDEFFFNEDPAVVKLIKKNLNSSKKTFKLKDDIIPQSLAKVLKTVFSQHKNHLQLNIGELVQILFHKDNLALVRNGLGKCGWTSPGNLQMIKLYESEE